MGRDPESRAGAFFEVSMLHEGRGPRADPGPLEANDRLRVVTQHVAAKRHVQARVDVGVHLRRHDDRDASDARRAEELRNLSGESVSLVPPGLVPHREAIVHRDAIDHDESDLRIAVRQLDGLLDQLLLFLEAVRFGEEDVLRDDIEIVAANLLEPIERHALRVDVDHLVSRPHDISRELQAEIRLAAPRLPVQERDAAFLDSPAQEVVQGPTAQGHLHLHRQSPGALLAFEGPGGSRDRYAPSGVQTTTARAVRSSGRGRTGLASSDSGWMATTWPLSRRSIFASNRSASTRRAVRTSFGLNRRASPVARSRRTTNGRTDVTSARAPLCRTTSPT